jgi:hypothetical protein
MSGLWAAETKLARVGPTTPKRAGRLADASVDQTEAPYMPIDNSMLEDALRPVAMGRTRYLHPEIGRGGRTATVTMSLVSPGRGPGNAPLADFHDMLNRVNTHSADRVDDLSPDRGGFPADG